MQGSLQDGSARRATGRSGPGRCASSLHTRYATVFADLYFDFLASMPSTRHRIASKGRDGHDARGHEMHEVRARRAFALAGLAHINLNASYTVIHHIPTFLAQASREV